MLSDENGTGMSYIVRDATLNDSKYIGDIQAKTWKSTYANILSENFLSTIDENERAEAASKRFLNNEIRTFVLTKSENDIPVVFVCIGKSREKNIIADMEIYAIYVLDEAQKSGGGELLIRKTLDYLKSQNGKLVFVSVFKDNKKARRFYEKMGGCYIGEDSDLIDNVNYLTASYIWDLAKNIYSLSLAKDKDVPEIRKLVNSAYKELADMGLNYTATYQDEEETRNRISKGRCFILKTEFQIVATILFTEHNYFTNLKSAYVGQFAVLPELKKSGLGTKLMDHCEKLAANEGYKSIQLDTAIPAIHLINWYKRRGYNIVGETHWEGKTYDSYIFEKKLDNNWSRYFEKNKTRSLRPLFLQAWNYIQSLENLSTLDLGSGIGTETVFCLKKNFSVHAVDFSLDSKKYIDEQITSEEQNRLRFTLVDFSYYSFYEKYDFIWAYHSLPFCNSNQFISSCERVLAALNPNGIFAGSFFGDKDEWVISNNCCGLTKERLLILFKDFEIISLNETQQDGATALSEIKRWHVFEVIAKKL